MSDQKETLTLEQLVAHDDLHEIFLPGARQLGDFTTWSKPLFDDLISVRDICQNYLKKSQRAKPLNILILAEPGAGKSFLVNQLADELKIECVSINLAAIQDEKEFVNLFEAVRLSAEPGVREEPRLVFFDEVDAAAERVWSLFLMPMWDGAIQDRMKRVKLIPSLILVFAASRFGRSYQSDAQAQRDGVGLYRSFEHWKRSFDEGVEKEIRDIEVRAKEKSNNRGSALKIRDFISRIDRRIYLPSLPSWRKILDRETYRLGSSTYSTAVGELEALYLTVSLISKHYPDVTCLERDALKALGTGEYSSARELEREIFLAAPAASEFRAEHLFRSNGTRERIAGTVMISKGKAGANPLNYPQHVDP